MLTIQTSSNVPDSTYFRTSDTEPTLSGETLAVYSGKGTRRSSWGAPETTSTVVLHDDDLVAVHVGYHHKHRGGQFWRYYTPSGTEGAWQQVAWPQLADAERQRVLDAAATKAPRWANVPGKLRTQHKAPTQNTRTAYKLVHVDDDGIMRSVYDGETVYELGKRLAERAIADHRGGYYSYPTEYGLRMAFHQYDLWPDHCYDRAMRLALLEVEIGGTIVEYGQDPEYRPIKFASTYLRPVRVIETFDYAPASAQTLQEVR